MTKWEESIYHFNRYREKDLAWCTLWWKDSALERCPHLLPIQSNSIKCSARLFFFFSPECAKLMKAKGWECRSCYDGCVTNHPKAWWLQVFILPTDLRSGWGLVGVAHLPFPWWQLQGSELTLGTWAGQMQTAERCPRWGSRALPSP